MPWLKTLIDVLVALPKLLGLIYSALEFYAQLKRDKEQKKVSDATEVVKKPEVSKDEQQKATDNLADNSF